MTFKHITVMFNVLIVLLIQMEIYLKTDINVVHLNSKTTRNAACCCNDQPSNKLHLGSFSNSNFQRPLSLNVQPCKIKINKSLDIGIGNWFISC